MERTRFEHLLSVELSPRQEPFAAFRGVEHTPELDEHLAEHARTIWCECKATPIAVLGCTPHSHRRVELWGVFDEHAFERHPITITRIARRAIDEAHDVIGFERAHIFTSLSDPRAQRWPEAFGFERWAELPAWGVVGEDLVMHEREWA